MRKTQSLILHLLCLRKFNAMLERAHRLNDDYGHFKQVAISIVEDKNTKGEIVLKMEFVMSCC